jgi:hypothetical protein
MGASYAVGGVGLFLAGLLGAPNLAWACVLGVGGPTAAGFVRHVLLWRGDAARLGFATPDPSWMWEVGLANLAIAVVAVLAGVLPWGVGAQVAVLVVMGVYMAGAVVVHAIDRRRKGADYRRNPWVSIGLPLLYALALLGFAVWGLAAAGLAPF